MVPFFFAASFGNETVLHDLRLCFERFEPFQFSLSSINLSMRTFIGIDGFRCGWG
jgi:hypothetical protein